MKRQATQAKIDAAIIAQTDSDSAWEKPIRVRQKKAATLVIPADLAARVSFLAQVHRQKNIDDWLTRIIRERVELEEAAFVGAKRELITQKNI